MKNVVIFLIALVLVLPGCGTKKAAESPFGETAFAPGKKVNPSSSGQLLTITLGVNDTYGKETACACIGDLACREYEELQQILKEKYNIDLQLTYFIEEYHLVDAMKEDRFDGALCKPWFAYMLVPEKGFQFKRVVDLTDPFGNQWLKGCFQVSVDSPVKTMADVDGKVLVAGNTDSFEKYHAAMRLLEKEGIKPSRLYFKASCMESVGELMDGAAEVAVISDYAMTASCIVDIASPDDFRTIGETERMPLCSVVLNMDKVSEADALRLQNALLEISKTNLPEKVQGKGFVLPASWSPVPYHQSAP